MYPTSSSTSASAYELCFTGNIQAVQDHILYDAQFDPSVGLEGACDGNQPSLIPILLQAGVTNIRSCLFRCIAHGYFEYYNVLMKSPRSWNQEFVYDLCAKGYASGNSEFIEDINTNVNPSTLLKLAAMHQRYDLIPNILAQHLSANTGYIAIGASFAGDLDLVKAHLTSDCVDTVIWTACSHGHPHIVRYCLDNFEPNLGNIIRYACTGQHANIPARDEIITMIMDAGEIDYSMALDGAFEGAHNDLIERMLLHGGDVTRGLWGACRGGHGAIAQRMIELGACVDRVALSIAAKWGSMEVISVLLQYEFPITNSVSILEGLRFYEDGYAIMMVSGRIDLDYVDWMEYANEFNLVRLAKALLVEGRLPFNSCTVPMSWFHIMDLYTHGIGEVGKYQPQLDQYITQVTAVVSQILTIDLAKLVTSF